MKRLSIILFVLVFISPGFILPQIKISNIRIESGISSKHKIQLQEISKNIVKNRELKPTDLNFWRQIIREIHSSKKHVDINTLIQYVLDEANREMQGNHDQCELRVNCFKIINREITKYIEYLKSFLKLLKPGPTFNQEIIRKKFKNFSPGIKLSGNGFNCSVINIPELTTLKAGGLSFNYKNFNFNTHNTYSKFGNYIEEVKNDLKIMKMELSFSTIELTNMTKRNNELHQILRNVKSVLFNIGMAELKILGS